MAEMIIPRMTNKKCTYFFERQRLESFKNWDFKKSKTCNEQKMAEAGFFCSGSESAVCFVCGKELDGWEDQDDPWVEHKKHAPQCQFVKNWKKEGDYTVREFLNLLETVMKNQSEKEQLNDMMRADQTLERIREQILRKFNP